MFDAPYYAALGLSSIHEKVLSGRRLSFDDGLALFNCPDITAVGALALHARRRLHGDAAFYVVNRQINYTNVCVNGCTFCAFRRDEDEEPGAFRLSKEDILERLRAARQSSLHLDELHIVGGCHPKLRLAWFEDVLRTVRGLYPDLPLKAFTPVEIEHFARLEGISSQEVLQRLQAAGLVMMPGGGAEIFDEKLRPQICPHKADAAAWLRISGEAHALGIKTNCTMLFGHLENYAQRVDHLCRLREQQDKSGGFTCFIPLPFLTENSRLKLPEERLGPQSGLDRGRVPADAGQYPPHQGLLDHDGPQAGPDRALVWGRRPGRHHCGGTHRTYGRGRILPGHDHHGTGKHDPPVRLQAGTAQRRF